MINGENTEIDSCNGNPSVLGWSELESLTVEDMTDYDDYLTIEETQKRIAGSKNASGAGFSSEEHDEATQSYQPVPMDIVIENPEAYIISENLPVCRVLWDKNIDTIQCSDYADEKFYVEIGELSEENLTILRDLINNGVKAYVMNGVNLVANRKEVCRITASTPEELQKLVDVFVIQDVQEGKGRGFEKVEDFLKRFRNPVSADERTIGSDVDNVIDTSGYVYYIRPNITLDEALRIEQKEDLYLPSEGRIYDSRWRLEQHQKYLNSLDSNKN